MNENTLPVLCCCLLAAVLASAGMAQELSLLGGVTDSPQGINASYAWSLEYQQGLGEHEAFSLTCLNEGHLRGHHRDGKAAQMWWHKEFLDDRLSLAAGLGGYAYCDSLWIPGRLLYGNHHGLGGIASLSASWRPADRWRLQVRMNWALACDSFDTCTVLLGVGYRLPERHVLDPFAPRSVHEDEPKNNAVAVQCGRTVLNVLACQDFLVEDETGVLSLEYRRAIGRSLEVSVAYLDEGDTPLERRSGVLTELWVTRAFFDDRLSLAAGAGPYVSTDSRRADRCGTDKTVTLNAGVSVRAAYRPGAHWEFPITWNRIITNYDRDSDTFAAGVGYRL
jgi:hypothetical protein